MARGRPAAYVSLTSMRTTRPSRNEYACVTSRSASRLSSRAAHDLVDADVDAALVGGGERARLHTRIDLLELPAPVVAHGGAAVHAPALEGVGPVDVGVQGGETASTSRALKAA